MNDAVELLEKAADLLSGSPIGNNCGKVLRAMVQYYTTPDEHLFDSDRTQETVLGQLAKVMSDAALSIAEWNGWWDRERFDKSHKSSTVKED